MHFVKSYNIANVVRDTGITIDELAHLCGVSRTTASKWVNKRSAPHTLIADRVHAMMRRLLAAYDHKSLPLTPRGERVVVKEPVLYPDGRRRQQPAYVRRDLLRVMGE